MVSHRQPTFSIGIPTYVGGTTLIRTLQALYAQKACQQLEQIVVAIDGHNLDAATRKAIQHPKLKVMSFAQRAGQSARIQDLCRANRSDYLILTNDDVIIAPDALSKLMTSLTDQPVDLLTGKVKPIDSTSYLQHVLRQGTFIAQVIAERWLHGDNYLTCNGRLIVVSRRFAQQLELPASLWNNDAFLFLWIHTHGWRYRYEPQAVGYYQLPSRFPEYLRQTTKFRFSELENQQFFTNSLRQYYQLPRKIVLNTLRLSFQRAPLTTLQYLILVGVTKLYYCFYHLPTNRAPYWSVDNSTKLT